MRKINYILIDSDSESHHGKSGHRPLSGRRYHFVINSEGLVIDAVDISKSVPIINGPVYDPDKYNRCSVAVRYCGSIRPDAWLLLPATSSKAVMRQRKVLLNLLVKLRKLFPEAKILNTGELDGKGYYHKNIIVNDAMNVLRKELSNLL